MHIQFEHGLYASLMGQLNIQWETWNVLRQTAQQ